ncbi:transmembrane amino acid transporter protein-domain-containing protein [Scheffersomyces xylosifermentans]|uniref:transmembrane amino acid transporter protein-domain-containing protein n=1 Tax=Scheffersomyces xylosifermentans TaxID=1304137 RepID=UPI00315C54A3
MSSMRQQNSNSLSNSPFQHSPPLRSTTPTAPSLHSSNSNANLARYESVNASIPTSMSYQEHISNLNNNSFDYKTVTKHLVNQEDTLKLQGGDIVRHLYHQIDHNVGDDIHPGGISIGEAPKRRTRSSSFSTYLTEVRRESTASDINVPGGFRREFLINKSLRNNEEPPNFLTSNFIEFLSIYGHFAGEDFSDDSQDTDDGESSTYEDVFDEESSLLNDGNRRNHYTHPSLPKQLSIPKHKGREQPKGTASIIKTFFLVFKSLVGSGVLFLPRAFYNGGLLFSILALSGFGLLTFFCYIVLIKSKKVLNLASFGELGFKTFGKPLKICILISIIISQIGFVATYILFTAENMLSFISHVLPSTPGFLTTANIVAIQCIFLIPLVLIRNLTKLSLVSLISSLFIMIGLVIIFYFSGLNLWENGIGPNITKFNPNSWSMLIGVAVTSFEGIGLILPIEASMAEPEKFPMVLSVSMFFITVLFVGVGTIGYTSFGDEVKSIIILNLPQGNLAVQSILILYSLAVFLTAPLQLFPAIKIGESLIFNRNSNKSGKKDNEGKLYHQSGKYNPQVKWSKNLFRALSVCGICTIAYLNADNIDKFVSFNGCFACIPLVYIYPPMIHLKTSLMRKEPFNKSDWFFFVTDIVLIIVGFVAVVYTTYQILFLN